MGLDAWYGRAFLPVTCVTPRKPVLPLERGMSRPAVRRYAVRAACPRLVRLLPCVPRGQAALCLR